MSKKKKSDFQFKLREFNGLAIKDVWYLGDIKKEQGYHTISKGVLIQFDNQKVYLLGPADEFNLKLGYGISFKEIKYWDREKKYFKPLTNVSSEWNSWLSIPILKSSVQWMFSFKNHYYLASHYQVKDFPVDINFGFSDLPSIFFSVVKVKENKKVHLGANYLTIYFDEEVKLEDYQKSYY